MSILSGSQLPDLIRFSILVETPPLPPMDRGLRLVEDLEKRDSRVITLGLLELVRGPEGRMAFKEIRDIAKQKGSLQGERRAYQFAANGGKVPEECKAFRCLFPGTIRRDGNGKKYFSVSLWDGEMWDVMWLPISDGARNTDRLVVFLDD